MRFIRWTLLAWALAFTGCATGEMTARIASQAGENASCALENFADCADRMARSIGVMQKLRATTRLHPDFLLPRDQDLLECSLAGYFSSSQELEKIAERQQLRNPEL